MTINIPPDELISFSHTLRVMFVNCAECDKNDALDVFNIFFSNIDTVDSKVEALEHFYANKYDLIIGGLKLPRVQDGLELIEKIRSVSKNITILTIASDLEQKDFTKLIELGVDGFIIKPIEIEQFSDVVHKTIEKLKNKEDIFHYRVDLENKVKEQVDILREKDKALAQQSKMAAMGEMMDAVAHQWKHPLTSIKMNMEMAKIDYEERNIDDKYFSNLYKSIAGQIDHMTTTLNEFRSFFRPNKTTQRFLISSVIRKSLLLMKDELVKHMIKTDIQTIDEKTIKGIENEFIHLVINLISNAKDAFAQNNISNPLITFKVYISGNRLILEVTDNAGGIPEDIIDNIFKANFTSKRETGGTGIGLYMSRQIVEKHSGDVYVKNIRDGVMFCIEFPVS